MTRPPEVAIWRPFLSQSWETYSQRLRPIISHEHKYLSTFHQTRDNSDVELLGSIKRIAQAVVYFDPAFQYIIHPGSTEFTWRDSTGAQRGSPADVIARIENLTHQQIFGFPDALISLMQRPCHPFPNTETDFPWTFNGWLEDRFVGVAFGGLPPFRNGDDAVAWLEFGFSFVHAAVANGPSNQLACRLQDFSPDLNGLWAFVERFLIPGVNERGRLEVLWNRFRSTEAQARGHLQGDKLPGGMPRSGYDDISLGCQRGRKRKRDPKVGWEEPVDGLVPYRRCLEHPFRSRIQFHLCC